MYPPGIDTKLARDGAESCVRLRQTTMASSSKPVLDYQRQYDNVDFRKAAGFRYPAVKCSYNRRDVLLFVSEFGNVFDVC